LQREDPHVANGEKIVVRQKAIVFRQKARAMILVAVEVRETCQRV
jgi:hypothetical protein